MNEFFQKKILKAYRERRVSRTILAKAKRFLAVAGSARYALFNPASRSVRLHCPDYVKPDASELAMVERIFRAFAKMKEDQKKVQKCYLPASIWQDMIDGAYSYLGEGLRKNDINKFHYFLANFGTWKKYPGVESTDFIKNYSRSFLGRLYLQNKVFYDQFKFWKWFYNGRKPISELTYPTYGNQSGAYIDGLFVGAGSFVNEIYGSLLSALVRDKERPVIADLGAGYGKLAYFILKDLKEFTFIDFDLPETLCLAAYYLMKAYPGKKVLLYGEDTYSSDKHGKYDLIFMPPWEIEKAGSSTVDLFINKNSLGEMEDAAVRNYIKHIADSTRYFFHMNHDITRNVYENGEAGLLGYEYPVPADRFNLVFRYPDIGHLLYQGYPDFTMDIFFYLYERKGRQGPPAIQP